MTSKHSTVTRRVVRWIGPRGLLTLSLGATLSVGGLTQAFDDVHFVVLKDLDAVRVVKQDGKKTETVARLQDGFAADSLFKLTRALPESLVSQKLALFDKAWLPEQVADDTPQQQRSVFHEEMQ